MAGTETAPTAEQGVHPEHDRTIHIVVNGTEKSVHDDEVSFDQAVALAFDPVPHGPNVVFTVSYRHAAQDPSAGTLHQGQSVKVKNGTVFNVTATDKS